MNKSNPRKAILGTFVILASVSMGAHSLANPATYGLTNKITSLAETQNLAPDSPLSPAQKTEVLLYWIANERQSPEAKSPVSDFPNYSEYVQSQLTMALFERGDAAMLDAISNDKRVAPWARDAARLGLGLKGDKAQIPALIRILKTDPRGEFRVLAAHALGTCGAKEALPLLNLVSKSDPYKRLYYGHMSSGYDIGPDGTYYPVREDAKEAFRNLQDEQTIAYEERFNKPFLQGLEEYRTGDAARRPATLSPWLLEKIGVDAPQPSVTPK
jgi:HEAT repeat protein